jgi:hypothetical protein
MVAVYTLKMNRDKWSKCASSIQHHLVMRGLTLSFLKRVLPIMFIQYVLEALAATLLHGVSGDVVTPY